MRVAVEGQSYRCVSQKLLDELWVVPAREEQSGARVPEIVKANVRQSGSLEKRLERGSGYAGKQQIIEGVIDQLKELFALARHRAKTLSRLLTRLTAKIAAYTCGQCLNDRLGRPLRYLANLLI